MAAGRRCRRPSLGPRREGRHRIEHLVLECMVRPAQPPQVPQVLDAVPVVPPVARLPARGPPCHSRGIAPHARPSRRRHFSRPVNGVCAAGQTRQARRPDDAAAGEGHSILPPSPPPLRAPRRAAGQWAASEEPEGAQSLYGAAPRPRHGQIGAGQGGGPGAHGRAGLQRRPQRARGPRACRRPGRGGKGHQHEAPRPHAVRPADGLLQKVQELCRAGARRQGAHRQVACQGREDHVPAVRPHLPPRARAPASSSGGGGGGAGAGGRAGPPGAGKGRARGGGGRAGPPGAGKGRARGAGAAQGPRHA